MASDHAALDRFHPLIRKWFAGRLGEPTEVQSLVWPRVAEGANVLVTAPTGSGKTLAAFLWALDRLIGGAWPLGAVRVLYVSPLKALNNDIQRNLIEPLDGLRGVFADAGEVLPAVRVLTRSGDTPAEERARMARRPPEILVTTPESLNILLTSRRGRAMLGGLATVILDEIHAVVGGKRGVHLITAVERLARLSGEFQRIALSATVRPLERVAEWVGGFEKKGEGEASSYRRRRVEIIASRSAKRYALEVRFPGGGDAEGVGVSDPFPWLVSQLRRPLSRNRSTLVFANSRRMVEKVTRLVNEEEPDEVVYSHHGSLSREVRAVVEERLKRGDLRGIVATNSLELGIDIGALDEVVLVQTPPSLASAAQRIGRAGHSVGGTSRGSFLPLFPRDLLGAAVAARAVLDGEIEPVRPIEGALDVLAQVLVSMTVGETWRVDELFAALRACDPYRNLSRRQFDLVLEMVAGRYSEVRVRELRPLVAIDRVDGTVRALPGAEMTVYASGGTIPDRGYVHLRVAESGALLGELDEEFVWERAVGDAFTLGVQTWRIERITHNDVLVRPAHARQAMAPFWRADQRDRGFELSERIGLFLERAEPRLEEKSFRRALREDYALHPDAADALGRYLASQRAATGVLPHRHRIVVEHVADPQAKGERVETILHTLWGGRVNRPFAMALQTAWRRRHGLPLEVIHDDDCIVVGAPSKVSADELLALVHAEDVDPLLREQLESTGFFGARFRAAAGCALLLPREGFRRRTPLWLSRQRAKELLEAVKRFEDFPIVLEAWRTCLRDDLDLASLGTVLDELRDGRIAVHEVTTAAASPFAANVAWRRANELMYEDDTPIGGRSRLRPDLLREVALAAHLRPRVPRALADAFRRKLQRTFPGYAPRSAHELLAWAVERVVIPADEWRELLDAMRRDHGLDPADTVAELDGKVVAVTWPGGDGPAAVCAVEALPRVLGALGLQRTALRLTSPFLDASPAPAAVAALSGLPEPAPRVEAEPGDPLAELVAEVLRFYGPVPLAAPGALLGLDDERYRETIELLADEQRVVVDELSEGTAGPEACDAENLERLLRLARAAARPAFEPLPGERMPAFLATWQGLASRGAGIEDLRSRLEKLFGFAVAAELWETEILPARLDPYLPAWLDALMAEGELGWLGCGPERLAFVLAPDRELIQGPAPSPGAEADAPPGELEAVMPPGPGRFSFEDLLAHSRLGSAELTRRLWRLVWSGLLTNDSFAAMRRGIASGFKPVEPEGPSGARPRRPRFERWKGSRPFAGSWCRIPPAGEPADAVERDELAKERARLLLDRYGVVFRELLDREMPVLAWSSVFRALRLMELSGEVVAGQFFTGVPGLQFASHEALRRLRDGVPEDLVWWVNAADLASPCGLALEALGALPRRVPGNHLVFHGSRLVVVSERHGRALAIRVGPDHPSLAAYLGFLKIQLTRSVAPVKAVVVETINGEPAPSSPFRTALAGLFHTTGDGGALRLMRRY